MNNELENMAEKYITKLRVISKIPSNGRLSTLNVNNKIGIDIYKGSISEWFMRVYNGDSRDQTLDFLNTFFQELDTFVNIVIYDSSNNCKQLSLLVRIAEQIRKSLFGINNLKETYSKCPKSISIIEYIENDRAVPLYLKIIQFLPENERSDVLKKPLVSTKHDNSIKKNNNDQLP